LYAAARLGEGVRASRVSRIFHFKTKPMSHIQSIRAEFLFEFANKQEWINKAQSWFSPYLSKAEKTICLDTGGNVLTTGKDFADAEVLETYPVKVYRLVRVSEVYANLEHSVFG
jgi:hypothetical protein